MLGKKMFYKRSVMIAIAVVALMTLTAGVAAAASAKAKKIDALGGVGGVGLDLGGTVDSKFKIKNDVIKNVKITTNGEGFGGLVAAMTGCEPHGKHSATACGSAGDILNGALIESAHKSKATLDVIAFDAGTQTLVGTLKGSLKADLKITGANAEVLVGSAKMNIASGELPSYYNCLIGINIATGAPIWGLMQSCIDADGPQALGLFDTGSGTYPLDPSAGPVLVPTELHVVDTGKFDVKNDDSKLSGKISVTADVVGGVASGPIVITKGKGSFAID
ncbi:hypothetical protein [Candidatus Lucifugimonas marina]|uniref:Uncharacterized protein n=1 Tax=Candidatus Lucifugimonas marina TaxID=3038979 RepID=A0AAJ5ZEY4_9CHLR|nr:hypothetical protein [SAR202 cluster bacterium JH702]MDG0869183.1 hypothetical protein [SAR202 cluster bacterium JH639]WFG35800.1 hypothetical protein GKN94_08875 [SAR202 cluster bacterium JH545]WFG39745.1 hypothetical protein GKO48_08985 [SAR202 cluster bacterium JH1073]